MRKSLLPLLLSLLWAAATAQGLPVVPFKEELSGQLYEALVQEKAAPPNTNELVKEYAGVFHITALHPKYGEVVFSTVSFSVSEKVNVVYGKFVCKGLKFYGFVGDSYLFQIGYSSEDDVGSKDPKYASDFSRLVDALSMRNYLYAAFLSQKYCSSLKFPPNMSEPLLVKSKNGRASFVNGTDLIQLEEAANEVDPFSIKVIHNYKQ